MIVCDLCGVEASNDDARISWALSFERGAREHYCGACARDNLRSIEGRLQPVHW